MTIDVHWHDGFNLDVQYGLVAGSVQSPRRHHPEVVVNTDGQSVLRSLRTELKTCTSFTFSVAFVSASAIALLKQELVEFEGKGTIITSDYLAFNSPSAFSELLNLRRLGIDVRIHSASAYHPKGYIFEHDRSLTVMMGSANLTASALVKNHEWNLKVSAAHESDLSRQVSELISLQVKDSAELTQEWIDVYASSYEAPLQRSRRAAAGPAERDAPAPVAILPNRMQREALKEIEAVRMSGASRAVVISATGTGKTILSALEVRAAKPKRLLFLAHREQILDRTMDEYKRVLGGAENDYGKLSGTSKQLDRRHVFATVQTLSRPESLAAIPPQAFDYVVIDEAHRAGAVTYQRILDHLKPRFVLGMTATPERLDGFNIFELFDHNVPYEIRLNGALEADMLAPFHYYGVADVTYSDGTTTTAESDLKVLVNAERVQHLVDAIETYGQAGVPPRGLIFVSRKSEATALATALNGCQVHGEGLRCVALTGDDSIPRREAVVEALEDGRLDYIVTVDVFNEGVDIPTVNQIIMLRNTASPTIFVQQLGRGLRKAAGKEYVVVIDVIGNYTNNYMIPMALFGDSSLNKESVRKALIAAEERGVLPGLSSVRFDRVSQDRVLRAIAETNLDSMAQLKRAITSMRDRVGGLPTLWDFERFDSVDPVILATRRGHFPALLESVLKTSSGLTPDEDQALRLLSSELMTSKRSHELVLLELLLKGQPVGTESFADALCAQGFRADERELRSAVDTFVLDGYSEAETKRYGKGIATRSEDGSVTLDAGVLDAFRKDGAFAHEVRDILKTGRHLVEKRYESEPLFTVGRQYGRRDAARILGWPRRNTSTIYGYRVDYESRVCPIFVTLHKSDEVTSSTAYEDALVDESRMVWFTRSRRTLRSREVDAIVTNSVDLHVFVKKDDADGSDFYYLGQATAHDARQRKMGPTGAELDVVSVGLKFTEPIERSLYDYFHPVITD